MRISVKKPLPCFRGVVFALISQSTACKLCKTLLNLIPHTAELAHDKLFRTLSIRRIIEADVQALTYPRIHSSRRFRTCRMDLETGVYR